MYASYWSSRQAECQSTTHFHQPGDDLLQRDRPETQASIQAQTQCHRGPSPRHRPYRWEMGLRKEMEITRCVAVENDST